MAACSFAAIARAAASSKLLGGALGAADLEGLGLAAGLPADGWWRSWSVSVSEWEEEEEDVSDDESSDEHSSHSSGEAWRLRWEAVGATGAAGLPSLSE